MTYADHVQAASRYAAALLTMPTPTGDQAGAVRLLQDDLAALLAAMARVALSPSGGFPPNFGITALVGAKVAERTGNPMQTPGLFGLRANRSAHSSPRLRVVHSLATSAAAVVCASMTLSSP